MQTLRQIKAGVTSQTVSTVNCTRDIKEVWYLGVCFGQIRPKGTPWGVAWGWMAHSGSYWYPCPQEAAVSRVLVELAGRNKSYWRDKINSRGISQCHT